MTVRPAHRLAVLAAAAALAASASLAACGDDDDTASTDTTAAETSTTAAGTDEPTSESDLSIDGAWARTSPAMTTAGAVYMEITNDGDADDALVDVAVDASVAARAELHETAVAEDDATEGDDDMGSDAGNGMGGDDDNGPMGGMMTMQEVDEIPVPAGETAVLEPGGYHVMLLELAAPLEVGSTIEVTLTFETAGDVVVEAEVRDTAP